MKSHSQKEADNIRVKIVALFMINFASDLLLSPLYFLQKGNVCFPAHRLQQYTLKTPHI